MGTYINRRSRTQAKALAARELNVSVRSINRMKICDKTLESVLKRAEKSKNALKHRKKCMEYAEMASKALITVKLASKACGISERQLYRYIAKLGVATQESDDEVPA